MDVQQLGFFQRLRLILRLIVGLLFHHGPPETARHTARWKGSSDGARPSIPQGPSPELRTFMRVIPIAQTQSASGIDVTLFSLVIFNEGFIVHGMHSSKYGDIGGGNIWHAQPAFNVVDDRGNAYQWRGGSAHHSRFEFLFSPSLDENAQDLTLTITQFRWVFPREHRDELDDGPWVFKVVLT